jgi:hypothetical protein
MSRSASVIEKDESWTAATVAVTGCLVDAALIIVARIDSDRHRSSTLTGMATR